MLPRHVRQSLRLRAEFRHSAILSCLSRIFGRKLEFVCRTEVADRHDVAHHPDAIAIDMKRESGRFEGPSYRLTFAQIQYNLVRGARRDEADRAGPTHDDAP